MMVLKIANKLSKESFTIITGGGLCAMEAGNKRANDEKDSQLR